VIRLSKKTNLLLQFFSSVKLTIVLLILIVLVFILASFLPQHRETAEVVKQLSPNAAKLFLFFGLADLYHSPLFYLLMVLLSFNLIICSLQRLPVSLKQYRASCFPEPSNLFENIPDNRVIFTDKEKDQASPILESCLLEKYGNSKKSETERGLLFCAERGRFSIFGVYAVHLGILIMIAGAVAGSHFGFEADINITEGESVDTIRIAGGKEIRKLDFSVRCDKFTVELYDNGAPKTYRSDLSFIRNNQVEYKGALLVNHPLTFADFRFYQMSYGVSPETKAIMTYSDDHQKSAEIALTQGDFFAIPQYNIQAHVLRVEENVMQMGPAVKLQISASGKDFPLWIFQQIDEIAAANPGLFSQVPVFNPGLFKPVVFSLKRLEQQYFTGLHIVRDPGVPFVAAGGALMVAGLLIIFLLPHRRIWIKMQESGTKTAIIVAGRSNRHSAGLEKQIAGLRDLIRRKIPS